MIRFSIVTEAEFQLEYDGPDVAAGLMDVRILAPGLLAVGDLLEAANTELNGDRAQVKALADANFAVGSFDVKLKVIQDLIERVQNFLGSQPVKDAEEVAKTAGVVASKGYLGFLGLKKWLRSRKIEKQSEPDAEGKIKIEISGDIAFTKAEVLDLLSNDKANRSAARIISPLIGPGIETVRLRSGSGQEELSLSKADLAAYSSPESQLASFQSILPDKQTEPRQSSRSTRVWILEPSFIRGHKWMVAEGENKFYVEIKDERFLDLIDREEVSFSANTGMDVILTQFLSVGRGKDTITYAVDEVIKIIKGSEQRELFT